MPVPARYDHLSLGVQAQPMRGAKFFLSSKIRRSPRRPSRATWMFGAKRSTVFSYTSPLPMRTITGWHARFCTFGVVSWHGSDAFISVPFLSSHGGVYSYRRPRSKVMFDRTFQVSVK